MMGTLDIVTGPVNIGNPHEITVRALAELVLDLSGSRSSLVFRPLPADDPRQRCPDITQAQQVLGWQPRVQLQDGLRRTIEYFDRLLSEGGEQHLVAQAVV
jgi:UDP-glucuronate decarboxylase